MRPDNLDPTTRLVLIAVCILLVVMVLALSGVGVVR